MRIKMVFWLFFFSFFLSDSIPIFVCTHVSFGDGLLEKKASLSAMLNILAKEHCAGDGKNKRNWEYFEFCTKQVSECVFHFHLNDNWELIQAGGDGCNADFRQKRNRKLWGVIVTEKQYAME